MRVVDINEIPGFSYGQAQNLEAGTGCTVILCEEGAVCGVDVRGGSPGTRETDALNPMCHREVVHAVLLTGGSAFGLDAAGGVMRCLEEAGIGRDVAVTKIPSVCAAVLFDLKCGEAYFRPDMAMGYEACERALRKEAFQSGCFGAGTGATIGKFIGLEHAMKGGIGAVAIQEGDLLVGAVIAVNCIGDVTENGTILAGCRDKESRRFLDSEQKMLERYRMEKDVFSGVTKEENTVIGCIMTNVILDKAQTNKLASIGQNGVARVVRPAHATFDGDTIFAMSSKKVQANPDAVGILGARAVERAMWKAVREAVSMHGFPALRDMKR